ncbi:hypothetical protein HYW44_03225 [Candidatus Daviesbacteria bacterium]|nr:hypothetical protein [Candidatus Daviesbacteria bacterium]
MPEVIFGLIAIAATALYVSEYAKRRKIEKDATPQPEDQAGFQTISQLTDKSRQVVESAQKDAGKLVEEVKEFDQKATQDFGQKLNSLLEVEQSQTQQAQQALNQELKAQEEKFNLFLKNLTQVLDNKTEASLNQFRNFLAELKSQSQAIQAANWEAQKGRVGELFENFESKLADFLLQTEQKMMLSVDLELKSARQLIDTYKVQQMNIIDENIVAMLEKTLSLVLAKNLDLKDQMELVYESLERAKTESFLV